jgi:hypothetical protein
MRGGASMLAAMATDNVNLSWLGALGARPSRALREGDRSFRRWRLRRRFDLVLRAAGDVEGARVLDVGGAEGLFAQRLLEKGAAQVTVVEQKKRRCDAGTALGADRRIRFVQSRIQDCLDLLAECDTLVSLRCIYHMGPDVHGLFGAIQASSIRRVVLQGRARLRTRVDAQHRRELWGPALGLAPGMLQILRSHGFRTELHAHWSFPVVIGQR